MFEKFVQALCGPNERRTSDLPYDPVDRACCKATDANRGNTGQYCSDWQAHETKRFGLFMRITRWVNRPVVRAKLPMQYRRCAEVLPHCCANFRFTAEYQGAHCQVRNESDQKVPEEMGADR